MAKRMMDQFQSNISAALEVAYEEDHAACLLHRNEPYTQQIREKKDYEGEKHLQWNKYFHLDQTNYFLTGINEKGKKTRGTVCFPSAKPTKQLIEACQPDMAME